MKRPREILLDTPEVSIQLEAGEGDVCLISFTGVGHALGGLDVQKPEFNKSTSVSGPKLFIIDQKRSWSNCLNYDLIRATIAPFVIGRKTYCLGNSMGGFNAVIATKYIDVDVCVVISPQYSIHPDIIPAERRWDKYVLKINEWKHVSLEGAFQSTTQYYALFAGEPTEKRHSELFPFELENVMVIEFAGATHQLARELSHTNDLYTIIAMCLEKRAERDIRAHCSQLIWSYR